jgi:uncharacterized protein (TIGR01777 family)
MKIAISGSSGFIGQEIIQLCQLQQIDVIQIPRHLCSSDDYIQELSELIASSDVVINLNGASILRRWTTQGKKLIYNSRVKVTERIVTAISKTTHKPQVLISASAIGIYEAGKQHNEYEYTKSTGFLGKLCTDWEEQALVSEQYGVRTAILRLGVVLGKNGGIVKRLYPLFRLGLGAVILPANSPFPFVHISDLTNTIFEIIHRHEMNGVFNLVANPKETQKSFARHFAKTLQKPLLMGIPGNILQLVYGKGATIMYQNPVVESKRLKEYEIGFQFKNSEMALTHIFRKENV